MADTIGTKGAELDLLIRQGATFGPNTSTLTNPDTSPVNLTGATIKAFIRKSPKSTRMPFIQATVVITNAAAGQFTWTFPATETEKLIADDAGETAADSTYVWDMELTDASGRVLPMLYGAVKVFREVAKD